MVVLDVITQLSGVKKWLHREDFDFEQFVETNVHEESASYFLQASPAQHFLVGFKDRNLEDEYLENLVVLSKGKFLSGYAVSLGLFILGPLVDMLQAWPLNRIDDPNDHSVMAKEAVPTFCALLVLLFGLVACAVAYETESLRRQRRVILQITGVVYLSYVVIMSIEFAMLGNQWFFLYGKQGWILKLIFFDLPPLASLLFMSLPTFLVGEIMFLAILSFSVIIPTVLGYWQSIADVARQEVLPETLTYFSEFWKQVCTDEDRPDIVKHCRVDYVYKMVLPYVLVNALMIAVVIVSALSEATNRRLFIWKKITRAQHEKVERCKKMVEVEKEKRDDFIYSMFPRPVAKELIKHGEENGKDNDHNMTIKDVALVHNLGRSMACMHKDVTILFTDIVGFTPMANACQPYEVMHFLHNLFSAFDELIEMDMHLWKVETVGDAFMVASGLGIMSGKAGREPEALVELIQSHSQTFSMDSFSSEKKLYRIKTVKCSEKNCNEFSAARAAVLFGKAAIAEARLHSMPNGKPCAIRVGAHTGDVCSGVIGTRMPRFCLFGDAVNTASRMESTSSASRLHITEATYGLVCDDPGFTFEDRGEMDVKGKGKMQTYMLM